MPMPSQPRRGPLVTDLYELTMAVSYLRRGMAGSATFSLFTRRLPANRGFLVAGGLEDCLAYLESYQFAPDELQWLLDAGFAADDVARFADLRFTGDVWAIPEGRVVLPNEPFLEVTAPIAEAQLVETFLVNQVTFQTSIATKAARCRMAAPRMDLIDFALRRTHGVDAGMAVARLTAMAGFRATSNVEAARRYGLRAAGTMAHSYVQAFRSEAAAFDAFAEDLPGRTTLLVDTYDTLAGVRAAIEVFRRRTPPGPLAVRLDSGDLSELAFQTRRLLDEAGLPDVRIIVSGGLDEYDLRRLADAGAPIDAAGVGTKVGVAADAPYLDSAYKLVEYEGRGVRKLSTGKATLPGRKQVWRRPWPTPDVLGVRDEPGPEGGEPLLVEVMRGGRRVAPPDAMDALAKRCAADLAALPEAALAMRDPVAPEVVLSDRLVARLGEPR